MTTQASLKVECNGTEYDVDVSIRYHIDKNYGADADGNRGIERVFYDGVEIDFVTEEGIEIHPGPELVAEIESEVAERFMELCGL